MQGSARSIERAFRAETGMTLRRWWRVARMQAAERLLTTSTTVDTVAQRVGCSSTNAFRRAFFDHHGFTRGYTWAVGTGKSE
ncbi:MAG TPA: helix-turn-helix domain-containing protein [Candidatus Corynebacterium faecigallinarum]|uniref:Helix-turn-helix domain-containing protein n=1 Tax=Candidatus Corynebacterium faecigallinarum TaxID=2838528 RepID=A0A9D2QE99_9CORY|nr:helix-turn-helix domain-containing protein [Candidatus Corynebacterium faecigallinarum]